MRPGLQGQDGETLRIPRQVRRDRFRGHAGSNNPNGLGKHRRDYHVIKTRRGYDPELLAHLEAHELTHLKLESEARQQGKNLFFATKTSTFNPVLSPKNSSISLTLSYDK